MLVAEFAIKGIQQFLFARFQSLARKPKHLFRPLTGNQSLDHRPRRVTMDIADHHG